ncbi:S-adenosyl-L-methionine-dependent methyltransferase [Aspergillus novoparasiticus]|uniref:catechol O-methyltransferase n=1 Tax=Aspergillus novoparasiticus TaxID=986946 RepID=A0A5N6E9D3_9EURO|nr:S-adenosyl-L-methionine-dependent methyltransferase [Aspergillus novoparasiticus]
MLQKHIICYILSSQPGPVYTRLHEAGRETKLFHFVYGQPDLDEIRGRPQKVLDLRNKFEEEYYMMTVGAPKGRMVTDRIDEIKPKRMIELGCYMGYSAILFGDAVRRNGGERYLSLELNPEWAAVAHMLIELAGLRDFVRVIVGRSDVSLDRLYRSGEVSKIELMFLDHYEPAYLTDLKLCEHHGMIVPGSVLAADNVLYPGNPPYLEYGGPMQGHNVERISERQVKSYMPESDTPAFKVIGNPNIVYQSVLRQPEGERDEVTRCVGWQEQV